MANLGTLCGSDRLHLLLKKEPSLNETCGNIGVLVNVESTIEFFFNYETFGKLGTIREWYQLLASQ